MIKLVAKNNKKRLPKRKFPLKGPISAEQLTSKNTPTGASIEEAVLLLQNELKRDLTPEKLKKVDSISGTNLISKLSEKEVKYIIRYVNIHEGYKLRKLSNYADNLHSKKEVLIFIDSIKNELDKYNSGKIKASPKYKSRLERFIKSGNSTLRKMKKKEKIAQSDFKKLNPDLYFGDEVGETFFSSRVRAAVYLPLGKLSFADKVIKAVHPDLNVLNLNNVLGTPDVVEDLGAQTITGEYSLGKAGTLVVQFINNALTDVNGPDLYIFEIGKVEPTNLEISKDGINWISVGKIDGGVSEVDIAEFVKPDDLFYYVRLTDLEEYSALPGADVDAIAAIGAALRLKLDSKVLFETGKSELKPEGIEALKELAESITVLKKGNVIVEGHTDNVGDANFNKKLSLARSKSVVIELKKLITGNQFKWKEKGMGETKPMVKNDSDENRAKNRRVEVLVVPN
ncbi:OmpA family protein [Tenacibaculum aquimarinum]|uniref:OmpA family protein n=1 Tax=Tenacibaculum aquimarinum TaxID=2910675 RepID=UPI001F0B5C7D|nr:OmpA family protein [Tenacibaculum aquimarinum]MCH3885786.1 OmpA family protein [Tenacibaculum aquimarinum]